MTLVQGINKAMKNRKETAIYCNLKSLILKINLLKK